MTSLITQDEVKNYLSFCNKYWTVLYGSFLNEDFIPGRSDIDVAIISQSEKEQSNFDLMQNILKYNSPPYDIKIFELLPLYLKIEIVDNYEVVFGDPLEISEYFYKYRKIWKDMETRIKENQFNGIKEKIRLLESRNLYTKKPN